MAVMILSSVQLAGNFVLPGWDGVALIEIANHAVGGLGCAQAISKRHRRCQRAFVVRDEQRIDAERQPSREPPSPRVTQLVALRAVLGEHRGYG